MAGRLPFNLQGGQNPLQDAQIRAALGLSQVDEALYLQQQRELQRDFQLRQLLLQDQIDQQQRLDSLVVHERLKQLREQLHDFPELQQHYSHLLLRDRLQREQEADSLLARAQLQQEELQRRALTQVQAQQQAAAEQQKHEASAQAQSPQLKASKAASASSAQAIMRDIAADSLAGNAVKRSQLEKRVFANPEDISQPKKRPRAGTENNDEGDRRKKKKDKAQKNDEDYQGEPEKATEASTETGAKPSAQALLDFATSVDSPSSTGLPMEESSPEKTPAMTLAVASSPSPRGFSLGTLNDLLEAVQSEKKFDDAASVLTGIKAHVEWSDSEKEDQAEVERRIAMKKGDVILLKNFTSVLPQLPEEPEVKLTGQGKKKKRKHKGLLDEDSTDHKSNGKSKTDKKEAKEAAARAKAAEAVAAEFPYPVDTWWPSVSTIRRERKSHGELQDEDDFEEESGILGEESSFRANMSKIRDRISTEVAPGVLEKIPHCRIHRMLVKKRKNPSAPELVHCFQVTELYPNDMMVCCSHCGTWRHAACGGHYKAFSIRECIDSPFTAVCDRCHEEEKILRDDSKARKRIDRQRSEQIRRGLCTSAAMRQASFSKHGGTYKWPLGSVSATHIGGHTRSVHHRHDKAEKQWMDMAQRLSRNYGYRPKERIKIRTKELERLLVSVEDAEGHTDRHNMMLFLLQDTLKEHPSGFDKRRRNIFDPEEDENPLDDPEVKELSSVPADDICEEVESIKARDNESEAGAKGASGEEEDSAKKLPGVCARKGCSIKPRFDSLFCSDSCGVGSLEMDLLRTFQYTSDMHPSLLRN